MSDTKDGGPAFPGNYTSPITGSLISEGGMSLRDWFAGQALQAGILSNDKAPDVEARRAYEYADAMIAARDAKKEEGSGARMKKQIGKKMRLCSVEWHDWVWIEDEKQYACYHCGERTTTEPPKETP